MDKFSETIAALIPKDLDDIVRENQDPVSLRLATAEEINARSKPLIAPHTRASNRKLIPQNEEANAT